MDCCGMLFAMKMQKMKFTYRAYGEFLSLLRERRADRSLHSPAGNTAEKVSLYSYTGLLYRRWRENLI